MSDTTLVGTSVVICDWRGRVIWVSGTEPLTQPGDFVWEHVAEEFRETAKVAFARVVTLSEPIKLEWQNSRGACYRAWLWPMQSPDAAVCILAIAVPKELQLLTDREREILSLLGEGRSTRGIAAALELSKSTVHTHLRRAREKLSLPSVESLASFAARYCHPTEAHTGLEG